MIKNILITIITVEKTLRNLISKADICINLIGILYEKKNLLPEGLSDFLFPMAERRLFVKNQFTREVFFHPLFLTGINLLLKLKKVDPKNISRY